VEDLLDAFHFYESREADLGSRFLRGVADALSRISTHPESAPVVRGTVRRKPLGRFPYSILFSVKRGVIRVLAVMHDSQRPSSRRTRS
jgi:plasmid stabilization system protein ParE